VPDSSLAVVLIAQIARFQIFFH